MTPTTLFPLEPLLPAGRPGPQSPQRPPRSLRPSEAPEPSPSPSPPPSRPSASASTERPPDPGAPADPTGPAPAEEEPARAVPRPDAPPDGGEDCSEPDPSTSVNVPRVRSILVRPAVPPSAGFDWSADPYRGFDLAGGPWSARGEQTWVGREDCGVVGDRLGLSTLRAPPAATPPASTGGARATPPPESGGGVRPHGGRARVAERLRRDLRVRVRPGEHLAFGTATDPYPPLERREGLTAAALRELARASGLRISLTTSSTLVTRDADLLLRVAERNSVQVNVVVSTVDPRLARFLEPHAPAPAARVAALRRLRRAGVRAGVFVLPVLPGITDGDSDLRSLVVAAAEAGALFLAHEVVLLEGPDRAHFLAGLRRAYPRIAARHEVWSRTGRTLPHEVRQDVAGRLRALARAHGIAGPSGCGPPLPAHETQRTFTFAAPAERVA